MMMFSRNSLLLWLASSLSLLVEGKSYCDNGNNICITGNNGVQGAVGSAPSLNNLTITYTLSCAQQNGWCAIGFGTQMAGSVIIAGWKNSTGGFTISTLKALGHSLPGVSLITLATPIANPSANAAPPSWAKMTFSFQVPMLSALTNISSSDNYIWAVGSDQPMPQDSVVAGFKQHISYGTIQNYDLITPSTSSASSLGMGKVQGQTAIGGALVSIVVWMMAGW